MRFFSSVYDALKTTTSSHHPFLRYDVSGKELESSSDVSAGKRKLPCYVRNGRRTEGIVKWQKDNVCQN